MTSQKIPARLALLTVGLTVLMLTGCQTWRDYYQQPTPAPLGTLSDPIWQNQESNAEHSDFVIYQHEFQQNTEWLNTGGEDHVKKIASRLLAGQDAPVVIERGNMSVRPGTAQQYPIHPNPELDMRRREIVVRCLEAMQVPNADERVVVAPAIAQGATANEAEAAYHRGLSSNDSANRGFGGFSGGMFGGGY